MRHPQNRHTPLGCRWLTLLSKMNRLPNTQFPKPRWLWNRLWLMGPNQLMKNKARSSVCRRLSRGYPAKALRGMMLLVPERLTLRRHPPFAVAVRVLLLQALSQPRQTIYCIAIGGGVDLQQIRSTFQEYIGLNNSPPQ